MAISKEIQQIIDRGKVQQQFLGEKMEEIEELATSVSQLREKREPLAAGVELLEACVIDYRVLSERWKILREGSADADTESTEKSEQSTIVATESETKEVVEEDRYRLLKDKVILDTKTGLEWLVGPDENINWNDADKWVKKLNRGKIWGKKWRLPTQEELEEIRKKGEGSRNMNPLFKTSGWWVWSTKKDSSSAFGFYFSNGAAYWSDRDRSAGARVFAVRSGRR